MHASYMNTPVTDRVDRIMRYLLVLDVILLAVNLVTGVEFTVSTDAVYTYGPAKWVLNMTPGSMMILIALVVTFYEHDFRKKIALYSVIMIPLVALAVEWFVIGVSMLGISVLFSLLIIYGNFYVGRSEDLVKKDSELMQQRADILVSQIQPHFLYNALTSIMNIKGNPVETRDSISYFGKYLRGNLDILRQKGPISIMFEIDHIENYMELVKLNFGDGLNLDIETDDRGFLLPALTLQSVIESVIELGYGHSNPRGTMTLRTFRDRDYHYAVLSDDGGVIRKCSDLAEGSIETFGLSSIDFRLRDMVNGDLQFQERNGDTVFLMRIPVA